MKKVFSLVVLAVLALASCASGGGASDSAPSTPTNYVIEGTIGTAGGNGWDMQLRLDALKVTGGVEYTYSFRAKAENETAFNYYLHTNDWEYAPVDYNDQELGTEWQEFSFTFTPEADATLNIKFDFGGRDLKNVVYIDDVSLTDGETELVQNSDFSAGSMPKWNSTLLPDSEFKVTRE